MTPAFPLCAEPRHEAVMRDLIGACVEFVRQRLSPPTLVGIVLTGSYARGEGSILTLPDRLKVLGDIEFFVVLERGADYRRLRAEMATWGPLAAARLGGDRVQVDIEFGPVDMGYLRRARPSIFVYDLKYHGKVLWGPPDLLEAIPPFGTEDIPREDAMRLLFNRMIEQLDAHDRLSGLEGEALLDVAYQRLKIVLDLAGSALAFGGQHCALYGQRPAALARMIKETPSLARRLPARFERDLADATLAKLAPDARDFTLPEGDTVEAQRQAVRAEIIAAVPAMIGVLQWELEELLGQHGDLLDLLTKYRGTPSLVRRGWEWMKLRLNPIPSPLPIGPLVAARHFWSATPRTLLYAAGALAYRDLDAPQPDLAGVARLLPLSRGMCPRDPEAQRRAIVALWRWCVRNA